MEPLSLVHIHILGGSVSMLAGAGALWFQKGSTPHRAAGNIFFVFMLLMSGTGAYLAYINHEGASILAGTLTFYMTATGWATVKQAENTIGSFEKIALVAVIGIAAYGLLSGFEAMNSETGRKDGFPAPVYLIFGSVAVIAALSDLSVLMRRGIGGAQRIARHLWRMTYAMFMAVASFFLGQQQVFPESMQGNPAFFVPVLLVIILLFFWLIKVLFGKQFKQAT